MRDSAVLAKFLLKFINGRLTLSWTLQEQGCASFFSGIAFHLDEAHLLESFERCGDNFFQTGVQVGNYMQLIQSLDTYMNLLDQLFVLKY